MGVFSKKIIVFLSVAGTLGCNEKGGRHDLEEVDPTVEESAGEIDLGDMIEIDFPNAHDLGPYLIDSYEASIVNGYATSKLAVQPKVSVNFADAKAYCEKAGKRLCSLYEWQVACKGPKELLFGFQDTFDEGNPLIEICDVARTTNNTPGSLPSKTGSYTNCKTTDLELYDMIGNATEWAIRDDDAVPVAAGAAFYQAESSSNCEAGLADPGDDTMAPTEESTDLGFRCCMDKVD